MDNKVSGDCGTADVYISDTNSPIMNQKNSLKYNNMKTSGRCQSDILPLLDKTSSRPKTSTDLDSITRQKLESKQVDECSDISLPMMFTVKYLGKCDASGLWGIQHTRKPVDTMVAEAKKIKSGITLPYLKLVVSAAGVDISAMPQNMNDNYEDGFLPIQFISYGVQDLVYTRVFAMITVRETANIQEVHPFECHAFVCDSRQTARQLTYSLAHAFNIFSRSMKGKECKNVQKKFAIDLRSPEDLKTEDSSVPDDSEV